MKKGTNVGRAFQIEDFVPSCVVCRNPIPEKRAAGRNRVTCSVDCAVIWKRYQNYVLIKTHCPACYHPSSPEERSDFRRWRIQRGDLRDRRGRPRLTFQDKMQLAIEQAIPVLRTPADVNHLASLAAEFEKLLTSKTKS